MIIVIMIMTMSIKMDNSNDQHDDHSNACDNGNNDDYHDQDYDHHDNDKNDDENLRYLRWVPALPDGTSLSLTSAFKEDKIQI